MSQQPAAADTAESHGLSASDLHSFLRQKPSIQAAYDLLVVNLRRKKLRGGHACAKASIELLRSILGGCKFASTEQMMEVTRAVGRNLMLAAATELTIGNVVRRILFLVKEEHWSAASAVVAQQQQAEAAVAAPAAPSSSSSGIAVPAEESPSHAGGVGVFRRLGGVAASGGGSASNILRSMAGEHYVSSAGGSTGAAATQAGQRARSGSGSGSMGRGRSGSGGASNAPGGGGCSHFSAPPVAYDKPLVAEMRQNLLASINEYLDEIDSIVGPICEQATEHVHAGETILVVGSGSGSGGGVGGLATTELFLRAAARKRRFHLLVAENAPSLDGHKLAASLCKAGGGSGNITVTLVPDSAVYALMCRVNKVLLAPLAVMADGGAICPCGHLGAVLAAKEFSIPVVCIAATYMLTPLFAHTQDQLLNMLRSPSEVLSYDAPRSADSVVQVLVPSFDYLPPHTVDVYVTNNGSHQPSYMYRLLSECYDPVDYVL